MPKFKQCPSGNRKVRGAGALAPVRNVPGSYVHRGKKKSSSMSKEEWREGKEGSSGLV